MCSLDTVSVSDGDSNSTWSFAPTVRKKFRGDGGGDWGGEDCIRNYNRSCRRRRFCFQPFFFAADSLPVRVALFPSTISSRMVIGRNLLCGSVELRGGSFWIVDSVTTR